MLAVKRKRRNLTLVYVWFLQNTTASQPLWGDTKNLFVQDPEYGLSQFGTVKKKESVKILL